MKRLLFFLVGLVTLSTLSCKNSSGSGNSPGTPKSDAAAASTISAAAHQGTMTCLLDGQRRTFKLNESTPDKISVGPDFEGPKDGLEISTQQQGTKESFILEFKKSGTTKIGGATSATNENGCFGCNILYSNPQLISYIGKDVTIVVTSYDQAHLTGTFSGKLINTYAWDNPAAKSYPQYIQITDGKFELNK